MKLVGLLLVSFLVVGCKSKEASKEAPKPTEAPPDPGSAASPTAGSAAAPAVGSAQAPAAGSAAAPAGDCGPNAYVSDDPPFCVDLPEKYRADMQTDKDPTGGRYFKVAKNRNYLQVSFEKGATDLAEAVESARRTAKAGADEKSKLRDEDVPDGKAIYYKSCQADYGCYDAMTVIKKLPDGIYTCVAESSTEPNDAEFIALCKTVRGK